ncbi:hypothetical protein C8R43DRAFT_691866 [Mycena crocata]|nr:hypothetical protein C8R43DRAFT_691866 [Mycena crocata]
MPLAFQDLNDDVLYNVLTFCDVGTILAMQLTSRRLLALGSSKQLWILVLRILSYRYAIEIPPDTVYTVPTGKLVDMVKRAVVGPTSWKSGHNASILQRFTPNLEPPLEFAPEILEILPAGHALIITRSTVECRPASGTGTVLSIPEALACYCELMDGGESARLLCTSNHPLLYVALIRILDVNLKTGRADTLFEFHQTTALRDEPLLYGDIFTLAVESHDRPAILLVNWRLKLYQYVAMNVANIRLDATVVPSRLVICATNLLNAAESMIHVLSLDRLDWPAFLPGGGPELVVSPTNTIYVDYQPTLTTDYSTHPNCSVDEITVISNQCPIHDGDWKITVGIAGPHSLQPDDSATNFDLTSPTCATLTSFRIKPHSLVPTLINRIPVAAHKAKITRTGYALERNMRSSLIYDVNLDRGVRCVADAGLGTGMYDMSHHGVLVALCDGRLTFTYYE